MVTLRRGSLREAAQVEIGEIRELSRDDLQHLTVKREPKSLQKLRDSHHRVARCFAAGLSTEDTAQLCGYSVNRVSMLRSDPAMVELTAHYHGMVTADWLRTQDHFMQLATANMIKAEAMLSDKLDDAIESGEHLPTRDLIAISRDAADRFGYGKTHHNTNVNVSLGADLEAARRRSARPREIEATPRSLAGPSNPSSPGPVRAPLASRRF